MSKTLPIKYGRRYKWRPDSWQILSFSIVFLVLLPLISILSNLFGPAGDAWQHIVDTNLLHYIRTSALLILGTTLLSALIAVSSAWAIAFYDFPGRRFFEWALILPLALPAYISAYAYIGILDYDSLVQQLLAPLLPLPIREYFMSLSGAIFIFAFALYPYLYLITRIAFQRQSRTILESARLLGHSSRSIFWKVALPLSRPAIAAGLALIFMETMNDYGLVKYFGVYTFTTGIFEAWYELDASAAATRLSALLMLLTFGMIGLELWQRRQKGYASSSNMDLTLSRVKKRGSKAIFPLVVCFLPFFFGFLLPGTQLASWSIGSIGKLESEFLTPFLNSMMLASTTAIIIVAVALVVVYTTHLHRSTEMKLLSKISTLGYSIPGAIIAIGIIAPFVYFQRTVHEFMTGVFGISTGLFLSSTIGFLLIGYTIRFLALAFNPLESGFERNCRNLDEAARILGRTPLQALREVDLPLLRGTIFTAAILVFVDVLKDLPLTLLLAPPNFPTLATEAHYLAENEVIAQAGTIASAIVLAGMIPVYILNRLMTGDLTENTEQ